MTHTNKILKSSVFKPDNHLYRERPSKVLLVLGNKNTILCPRFSLPSLIVDLIMKYIYLLVNFV